MDDINNWIVKNNKLFYYFAFSMAIPSTVLYILEMATIVGRKQFAQFAFYKLFCIRGIADVLTFVASCYGNRLPALFGVQLLPIYRLMPGWAFALFFYFTTSFTYQLTNIATLLILLNRFTAIAFPIQQKKKIWEKSFSATLLLMVVLPLLSCFPIIGMNVKITPYEMDSGFYIDEKDPELPTIDYANKLKAIVSLIFLLLSLIVNLSTLIAYKRSKQKGHQNSQNGGDVVEKKLLLYALFTFAGHALVALFLMIIGSGILYEYSAIIYIQYPWVNDLCTLVLPSWMLLASNDTFRHQFFKDFCPKCRFQTQNIHKTPVTVVTAAANPRRMAQTHY